VCCGGVTRGKNIIAGGTPFGASPLDGVEPPTETARPMWGGAQREADTPHAAEPPVGTKPRLGLG
jgi:hypothetical protein